jgi:hypothetical protein
LITTAIAEPGAADDLAGSEKLRIRSGVGALTSRAWHVLRPMNDLRYSVRALLRMRGVAAVSIASLALGIAATTTMFSAAYAALLRLDRLEMLRQE